MPSAYGLCAALGCIVGVLWLRSHRAGLGVSENELWAALWTLLFAGIVGAKVAFIALGWEHYARGELRLFADFTVGFVFFGGLIAAGLAGALFAHLRGLSFTRGADYFAVAVPVGHALGRVGCFLAGCCHGRLGHPVQLYEATGLLAIALAARAVLAQVEVGRQPQGSAFCAYVFLYGALRLLLDPLRGDGRPERLLGLSVQQGIALLVMAAATAWWRRRGTLRPAI